MLALNLLPVQNHFVLEKEFGLSYQVSRNLRLHLREGWVQGLVLHWMLSGIGIVLDVE